MQVWNMQQQTIEDLVERLREINRMSGCLRAERNDIVDVLTEKMKNISIIIQEGERK